MVDRLACAPVIGDFVCDILGCSYCVRNNTC